MRKLLSLPEKAEHHTIAERRVKVVSNSVLAVGAREDRMRQDKVHIRDMDEVESKGTWRGEWKGDEAAEQGASETDDKKITKTDEGQYALTLSMIDGHGGAHVADLVHKGLHACIAWAMCSDPGAVRGNDSDPAAVRGDDEALLKAIRQACVIILYCQLALC